MENSYSEEKNLISREEYELSASAITFLRKTVAFLRAEILANYEDDSVDRTAATIYWLKPFIQMVGGEIIDNADFEPDSELRKEIDVAVVLKEQIQYIVYLNGTREIIIGEDDADQEQRSGGSEGFRSFLYYLLRIARTQLAHIQSSIEFLVGSETSEILQ